MRACRLKPARGRCVGGAVSIEARTVFAFPRSRRRRMVPGRARLIGSMMCVGVAALLWSEPAVARSAGARQTPKPQSTAAEQSNPPEPLIAIVTLSNQHIEVFGSEGSVGRSRVSTGQAGHDTPTGVFSILQRNRFHRSNIYSNAPMPYMQRLTWSGIALHEGYVPNYRASHGCIRLPSAFAQTLWGIGRIGMRVIVTQSPTAPVAIEHARLPSPKPSSPSLTASRVRVAAAGAADPAPSLGRLLSPHEAAQARLANAVANKSVSERAIKPALETAAATAAEAHRLSDALKASALILAEAEEQLEVDNQSMATVQTEQAEEAIRQRIRLAETGATAAREAHEKLRQSEALASDAAFAAARAAREAQSAAEAATEELSLARKAIAPISVFISRKTGQIYVRQGFQELYEGPIAIAEPDRPLGTHVFTAMQERGAGASLGWVSVTVPTSGGEGAARRGRGEAASPEKPMSAATEALDRIALPDEVRDLMSERLWPGASLIVSDFGLGETNQHTDFVILTR